MKNINIEGVLVLILTIIFLAMAYNYYAGHGVMKAIGTGIFTIGYILVIIGFIKKTAKSRKK